MTAYRVRSTDGANADNGSTWALAKLDIAGFAAVDAAGDTAYISQAHAESTVGSVTWAFAGTLAAPTKVVCGNDGADPPTALATSATVTLTGAGAALTPTGTAAYLYGLTLIVGTSGNPVINTLGSSNGYWQWESCKFQIGASGVSTGVIRAANGAGAICIWRNCEVKFAAAGQSLTSVNGFWHWNGGGITSGSTSPTSLISSLTSGAAVGGVRVLIENCDFSNGAAGMNLIGVQIPYAATVTFRNCKLPASWTGAVCTAFSGSAQGRVELFNCISSASSNNYTLKIIDGNGNIDTETTFVKAGGASDGTTSISWKLVSSSGVGYPAAALFTPEIMFWNEQVGVLKTITIDILRDSATNLTNADIWPEVNYPNSSVLPTSALATGRIDVLTAASDHASSSAGWTTTGMGSPNKQHMVVTCTPQAKGWLTIRVVLAKASATLYVDPKVVIT